MAVPNFIPQLGEFNEFVEELTHHDWYYEYSDDGRVWRHGRERKEKLLSKAKKHPLYMEAYSAFQLCAFDSQGTWTERLDRRIQKTNHIRQQIIEMTSAGATA